MTSPASVRTGSPASWAGEAAWGGLWAGLRPLQGIMMAPVGLFLAALAAMLLPPPDVPFYEIDRVAFLLLAVAVIGRAVVKRERFVVIERATWPMIGLTFLAVASVIAQPFDNQTWSLLAAKFMVPFALFHLAGLVFREERRLRQFEIFSLVVLAYLCFTAIAFLVGANSLIFPRFILDESLGYHVDRARGPLLQAVANGVSLNLLGVLALHAFLRRRIRGLKAALLLGSLPVAILATMTRAVWLSFAVSVVAYRSEFRRSASGTHRAAEGIWAGRIPAGGLRGWLADVPRKTFGGMGCEPHAGGTGAARQRI